MSYVHRGSSVVLQEEIDLVVNATVVGTVFAEHGQNNLYMLVVVHLIPHPVSVQIQQLVENVSQENIALLVHHNQQRANQVSKSFICTIVFRLYLLINSLMNSVIRSLKKWLVLNMISEINLIPKKNYVLLSINLTKKIKLCQVHCSSSFKLI